MPKDRREYFKKYLAEKYKERRDAWFSQHGPCRKCGSWENLELDHVNPADKVTNVVWMWRKERREIELAKCQALCRKCHAEKTKVEAQQRFTLPPTEHGTYARYTSKNYRCRCNLCRAAGAAYKAAWRGRTGKTQTFYNRKNSAP